MSDQRIERIMKMESYLDESEAAIRELSEALEGYAAVRGRFRELERYYESPEWLADFEADEEGRIPGNLKRGVLSEDAVFDLITEHEELLARLQDLLEDADDAI